MMCIGTLISKANAQLFSMFTAKNMNDMSVMRWSGIPSGLKRHPRRKRVDGACGSVGFRMAEGVMGVGNSKERVDRGFELGVRSIWLGREKRETMKNWKTVIRRPGILCVSSFAMASQRIRRRVGRACGRFSHTAVGFMSLRNYVLALEVVLAPGSGTHFRMASSAKTCLRH